jgi:hypothetical protein
MSAHNVISQITDGNNDQGKVLMFKSSAPTAGVAGISKGALWLDSSTGILYQNSGTSASTSWTAVSPSYGDGITGSVRVAKFFQDAAVGVDGLDMLWIGDSNTSYNGKGWTDGFAAAMHFAGANMYGSPAYQSLGNGAVVGYKMWAFNTASAGSPATVSSGAGSANVSAALKLTHSRGSGQLSPNGAALDFLRVEDNTTVSQGTGGLTLWMYQQGPNPSTSQSDDAFTDVCPIGINDQLIVRMQVNIGSGTTQGRIVPAFTDTAQSTIVSTTFQSNSPSANEWQNVEVTMPANPARIAPYQGFVADPPRYRMTATGEGGGTLGLRGPLSVGLWSVYRYVKGFASTSLHYRGGATLTQIATDISQASRSGKAVQNYLKYLRERQRSVSGASGRVVVCIQGGVNSADWAPSNPSVGITAFNSIRESVTTAWTELGYPLSDLGFLVMVSHPTQSNDSALSALRSLAQSTFSSPSGDTLNVNLNTIYPYDRAFANGFFDRSELNTAIYDPTYAHFEENRHGYEIISCAVLSRILRTR